MNYLSQKDIDSEMLLTSFPQLFEEYRGILYAIALRMLGYGEDAKDAVQETFIKAYANLHTLKNRVVLKSWLNSILYNHCLMELRSRKKKALAFTRYAKEKELLQEVQCNIDQTAEEIKCSLADLSETLQLTTMLRFFSKHSSYGQIATILSVPVGTVRSRLAESRSKLASLLTKTYPSVKNNKAKEMEDLYNYLFSGVYDDAGIRNAFFDHFDEHVFISLTSGKTKVGAEYMRKEIEFDLKHGARATLAEVNSTGNISIVEIININPSDKPDLCPSAATFISVHPESRVEKMYLHNAPKLPHWQ